MCNRVAKLCAVYLRKSSTLPTSELVCGLVCRAGLFVIQSQRLQEMVISRANRPLFIISHGNPFELDSSIQTLVDGSVEYFLINWQIVSRDLKGESYFIVVRRL